MAVYAISDLHLAFGINKPMDIFGGKWVDYMDKIENNWKETVSEDDYVIIPGDISWATYLKESYEDFRFIESLPGKKIISKGNHDYWWTTLAKLHKFLEENSFKTISFLHNNSFRIGKLVICGTRGWRCPGDDGFSTEDQKIYDRELQRLELSLKDALLEGEETIIAVLHFPPFNTRCDPSGFVKIMEKYNVKMCIYGHLHGGNFENIVEGRVNGIFFKFVSADYLDFKPLRLEIPM
jgi:predicted phosphohydrolase